MDQGRDCAQSISAYADVAELVQHLLAKQEIVGSIPIVRSMGLSKDIENGDADGIPPYGQDYKALVAEARERQYALGDAVIVHKLTEAVEALEQKVEVLVAENYDLLMQIAQQ